MVFCPECGERNREGSKFCRNCGALIEEKPLKSRFISGDKFSDTRGALEKKEYHRAPHGGKEGFDWGTVVSGALLLVILMLILGRIMGFTGVLIATGISIIYVISSARRKASVPALIVMTLMSAAAISAYFSV